MPNETQTLEKKCIWKTTALKEGSINEGFKKCCECNGYDEKCSYYSNLTKFAENYSASQEQVA